MEFTTKRAMTQTSSTGRRANPRRSLFADAQLTLANGSVVRGQISDLSANGCYIETLESIPANSRLQVCISDDWRCCDLTGRVTRLETGGGLGVFGMAVAFQNIRAEERVTLNSWLAAIRAQGGRDNDRRKAPRN